MEMEEVFSSEVVGVGGMLPDAPHFELKMLTPDELRALKLHLQLPEAATTISKKVALYISWNDGRMPMPLPSIRLRARFIVQESSTQLRLRDGILWSDLLPSDAGPGTLPPPQCVTISRGRREASLVVKVPAEHCIHPQHHDCLWLELDVEACEVCGFHARTWDNVTCDACDRTTHLCCTGLSKRPDDGWQCTSCGGNPAPASKMDYLQEFILKSPCKAVFARIGSDASAPVYKLTVVVGQRAPIVKVAPAPGTGNPSVDCSVSSVTAIVMQTAQRPPQGNINWRNYLEFAAVPPIVEDHRPALDARLVWLAMDEYGQMVASKWTPPRPGAVLAPLPVSAPPAASAPGADAAAQQQLRGPAGHAASGAHRRCSHAPAAAERGAAAQGRLRSCALAGPAPGDERPGGAAVNGTGKRRCTEDAWRMDADGDDFQEQPPAKAAKAGAAASRGQEQREHVQRHRPAQCDPQRGSAAPARGLPGSGPSRPSAGAGRGSSAKPGGMATLAAPEKWQCPENALENGSGSDAQPQEELQQLSNADTFAAASTYSGVSGKEHTPQLRPAEQDVQVAVQHAGGPSSSLATVRANPGPDGGFDLAHAAADAPRKDMALDGNDQGGGSKRVPPETACAAVQHPVMAATLNAMFDAGAIVAAPAAHACKQSGSEPLRSDGSMALPADSYVPRSFEEVLRMMATWRQAEEVQRQAQHAGADGEVRRLREELQQAKQKAAALARERDELRAAAAASEVRVADAEARAAASEARAAASEVRAAQLRKQVMAVLM